eukprot:365520-Chlamydomonas_euryale.AAC.20
MNGRGGVSGIARGGWGGGGTQTRLRRQYKHSLAGAPPFTPPPTGSTNAPEPAAQTHPTGSTSPHWEGGTPPRKIKARKPAAQTHTRGSPIPPPNNKTTALKPAAQTHLGGSSCSSLTLSRAGSTTHTPERVQHRKAHGVLVRHAGQVQQPHHLVQRRRRRQVGCGVGELLLHLHAKRHRRRSVLGLRRLCHVQSTPRLKPRLGQPLAIGFKA